MNQALALSSVTEDYGVAQIQILGGLEVVHKRPSTYTNNTSSQRLHHMVYEVVGNAVDEALTGHCTLIQVYLNKDGSVTVRDNGRGIPAGTQTRTGLPVIQVVFIVLYASGKFDDSNYRISGGLHGMGASVVNMLSSHLHVQVDQDGFSYTQSYERGTPTAPAKQLGPCNQGTHGTTMTFMPDRDIFPSIAWNRDILEEWPRETVFLIRDLEIFLYNLRRDPTGEATCPATAWPHTFCFQNGLKDFVSWLEQDGEPLCAGIISGHHETDKVQTEFTLVHNPSYSEQLLSFANNISIPEDDTHMTGFCQALFGTANDYTRDTELLRDMDPFLSRDKLSEDLTMILSVRLQDAQLEGQAKQKLGDSYVRPVVERVVYTRLTLLPEQNPTAAKAICDKAMLAREARTTVRTAREMARRETTLSGLSFPSKLTDCSSRNPGEYELFIAEGDSVGGSTKLARNRENQAVFPLRVKILNVERAPLGRISTNAETRTVTPAFGTGVLDTFSLENL